MVLSKQLPLFCAELQVLSRPRIPASDVFGLYEVTGRLLVMWDELCHGYIIYCYNANLRIRQEHGFELDAFFEPHVVAWLRDAAENDTHEWVSRSVGMDSVSAVSSIRPSSTCHRRTIDPDATDDTRRSGFRKEKLDIAHRSSTCSTSYEAQSVSSCTTYLWVNTNALST